MARKQLDKKKISFNVPTALLKEIEVYCKENTLPLTQGIHILVRYGLDYAQMMKNVPNLLSAIDTVKLLSDENKDERGTE